MVIENEPAKYTYPIQMTSPFKRENWTVSTDHCYARPWSWKPESSFLKPTRTLFSPKNKDLKPLFASPETPKDEEEYIDIETELEVPTPVYDINKAVNLMKECEKHAALARNNFDDEIWEDKVIKTNWTSVQHRLFNGFVNILNNFYLSKMSQSGVKNEPILRRTVIDKAVQRARRLFATVSYDNKLMMWLHQILLDNLDQANLAVYLDILQTLKSKIPKFVDKLFNNPNSSLRVGPLSNENLLPLLKSTWDPVASSLMQDKPKKLPGSPVIVLMPCSPTMSKRNQKWMCLLSHLGHVVSVPISFGTANNRMTMTNCIDQMFAMTRGRVQEVRENYPGRNIILVGAGAGATLALQVAQMENVFCVVSLGFSLLTPEGKRGEPDDGLLELQCPVLFVIGQSSNTSLQEDMEDLRERMRVETGLIVVGSADNNLIVSKKKKREEGITQSIVDRCIIDEIGEFISSLILSPFPPQVRQSPTHVPTDIPTKKVGRPPGKAKSKLEAKWAAQVAQARMQAYNLNRNIVPGGQLSTLLQGGIKTIPAVQPKQAISSSPSTIKVLENVQLTSQATAKLMTNASGRTINLSKLSMTGQRTTGNNVILLPDGTKFIATKRLQNVPVPVKRQSFVQAPQPIKTTLPPPTNLTTQDIMDLPIIFADDNQILDPNMPTDLSTTSTLNQPVTQFISPQPTNKFMLVSKPTTNLGNFIINTTAVKRPNPVPVSKQQLPAKYTKIILSKKATDSNVVRVPNITKTFPMMEPIDLENEIAASSIPKPGAFRLGQFGAKKEKIDFSDQLVADDDDPDYVPPKNLKI